MLVKPFTLKETADRKDQNQKIINKTTGTNENSNATKDMQKKTKDEAMESKEK